MAKCMKCGRPVLEGVSVCGVCNPAKLPAPASRQAHGSLAAIIIVAALVMGLASVWLFGGDSGNPDLVVEKIRVSVQTPTSLTYEISVMNDGTTDARIFCRLVGLNESGATLATGAAEIDESIPPGEVGIVEVTLETAVEPDEVVPDCA